MEKEWLIREEIPFEDFTKYFILRGQWSYWVVPIAERISITSTHQAGRVNATQCNDLHL